MACQVVDLIAFFIMTCFSILVDVYLQNLSLNSVSQSGDCIPVCVMITQYLDPLQETYSCEMKADYYDGDRQRRPQRFWTARSLKTVLLTVTAVVGAVGLVSAFLVSRGSLRHPRTCADAGTRLYKLSGPTQVLIDEWDMIQVCQ